MDQSDDLKKKLYILTGRLLEKKSAREKSEVAEFALVEEIGRVKNLLKERRKNES